VQNKNIEALNTLRRLYYVLLKYEGVSLNPEILHLLRQAYYKLGMHQDYSLLDELNVLISKKEISLSDIRVLEAKFSNREILLLGLYLSSQKRNKKVYDYYRERLEKRDIKTEFQEFTTVLSPFYLDAMVIEW
jgi:hypothetical protein